MADPELITTEEARKAFGVTRVTMVSWNAKGCPHERRKDPDGKTRIYYRPSEIRRWLESGGPGVKMNEPRPGGRPIGAVSAPAGGIRSELEAAELRKRIAQAAKLEMDVKEREGILVDAADVERANIRKFTAIRQAFETLPGRASAALASMSGAREIEDYLRAEVTAILRELATR